MRFRCQDVLLDEICHHYIQTLIVGVKAVTDAVNGLNDLRSLRVQFNSFSQLADRLIERATIGHVVLTPYEPKEFVSVDNLARPACEQLQDFDFTRGEFDRRCSSSSTHFGRQDFQVAHWEVDLWNGR